MTVKELRRMTDMTQNEFAAYFGWSKRTVESWEQGKRTCPEPTLQLMWYNLEHEGLIKWDRR